jgi:hypothetical protein
LSEDLGGRHSTATLVKMHARCHFWLLVPIQETAPTHGAAAAYLDPMDMWAEALDGNSRIADGNENRTSHTKEPYPPLK